MSYDFNFWRYKKGADRDHKAVYENACRLQKELPCLETLPIEEILEKIDAAFGDWEKYPGNCYVKEQAEIYLTVITTSQTVCLKCTGMSEEDMNRLIDVMKSFGCPYYDSYLNRRFDSWTDG